MTLDDILEDIYALEDELRSYERKYNVLSETFYTAYTSGEEPHDDAWVRDWTAWASAYKLWLRRRERISRIDTKRIKKSRTRINTDFTDKKLLRIRVYP